MAVLDYSHTIGGKGVATGLPVRRGSHLYEHDPDWQYPGMIDKGMHTSQHQYTQRTYRRLPHLPILNIREIDVDNPDRPGNGNFTRRQFFVIKAGQPLMAARRDDPAIGLFKDDGGTAATEDRHYIDPQKMKRTGTIDGFFKANRYQLKDTNNASADAPKVITETEYNNLTGSDTADTDDQDDYKKVTENDPVSIDRYQNLSDEEKEGWFTVYENNQDTNDQIATGGVDMYAKVEKALFGSTDRVEHVTVDAGTFYFTGNTDFVGFVSPSSGGADRTLFYNEVDQEAMVTLPSDGDPSTKDFVEPIGSVTDVSADNISAYENSAAYMEAQPTMGVSEDDLEQAFSHVYHNFTTGVDAYQPMRTGAVEIPFIDISALESLISNNTDMTWGGDPSNSGSFNFVDQTESRSGAKVGVYNETDISIVNKASLLTERDSGYANLHHNLPATFLAADRKPSLQDQVKPDLFGNWTLADQGILESTGGAFGGGFVDATEANQVTPVDMDALGLGNHVVGSVLEVKDTPKQGRIDLTDLRINPIFQNRIPDSSASRNLSNAANQRVGGSADTAGADQLLSDAFFLALGGANDGWITELLPDFNGYGQDVSNILESAVLDGAFGKVRIGFDTTNIR